MREKATLEVRLEAMDRELEEERRKAAEGAERERKGAEALAVAERGVKEAEEQAAQVRCWVGMHVGSAQGWLLASSAALWYLELALEAALHLPSLTLCPHPHPPPPHSQRAARLEELAAELAAKQEAHNKLDTEHDAALNR